MASLDHDIFHFVTLLLVQIVQEQLCIKQEMEAKVTSSHHRGCLGVAGQWVYFMYQEEDYLV